MAKDFLTRLDKGLLDIIIQIGDLAFRLGYHAYLVGGPVRDLLLHRANGDIDIAVEGQAMSLAEKFHLLHAGSKKICYPAFKTATVELSSGVHVDFATARQESYAKPGVFPKVKASNITEDLLRRDFTINAMAIDISPGQWGRVVDPFGGMADLRSKRIRILHSKSFIDDPTRIVRAARFKARLGFSIERKTLKWLKEAVEQGALNAIKPQRYGKEYNKILKEPRSQQALKSLASWGAFIKG